MGLASGPGSSLPLCSAYCTGPAKRGDGDQPIRPSPGHLGEDHPHPARRAGPRARRPRPWPSRCSCARRGTVTVCAGRATRACAHSVTAATAATVVVTVVRSGSGPAVRRIRGHWGTPSWWKDCSIRAIQPLRVWIARSAGPRKGVRRRACGTGSRRPRRARPPRSASPRTAATSTTGAGWCWPDGHREHPAGRVGEEPHDVPAPVVRQDLDDDREHEHQADHRGDRARRCAG